MTLTVNHSTPADGSFSATGAAAWNATHSLSGTIDVANGGTGQTTTTAAINALLPTQATNSGKYLTTDGTNTSWGTVIGGVSSVTGSGNIASSGGATPNITFTGTLPVANGGSGAATLTGILKGNGTSAFSAATANTDYQSPITLTTIGTSGAATFNGTTLNIPQYTGGGGGGGGPILESQIVISQNYTLTSNTNGLSIAPVSVATGYAVTVPTGQVWLIWNT
jgi:hypothetical protein